MWNGAFFVVQDIAGETRSLQKPVVTGFTPG